MEQKLIEGTGLVSSSIALGTWSMGGWTIDRILAETITDPVGPEFMAPPARDEEKS